MAKTADHWIARIVDGAQPHCDEPLTTAMVCNHAGTLGRGLTGVMIKATSMGSGRTARRMSELPDPVLLAAGPTTLYAFKFKHRGYKVKLKKGSEVARWPRRDITVETAEPGFATQQFSLVTGDGHTYPLEVTTGRRGREVVELFLTELQKPVGG